jgi:DNA polymerase III subunit beta
MKIIINKSVLLLALSRIQSIVEKSSIMPITANALITAKDSKLTVSATNLEIGMIAHYNEITIEKEGTLSVNARKFFEIIRELPEENITITEKENYHIDITSNTVHFNIIGLPPEDFPLFFQHDSSPYSKWETEKVKHMIDYTAFSISGDETRLNIAGAFIERLEDNKLRMVTTDGYRLSMIEEEIGEPLAVSEGILIPHKGIIELRKILSDKKEEKNVYIKVIKNSLSIKIGEIEIFIRLIEKKFPEYKYIIPPAGENELKIKAEKEKIKSALRRMSIIASENKRPVTFNFKDKKLELSTEDSELGSVQESIEQEKEVIKGFSFSINGKYFLDILNAVDDDVMMEINATDKNKPLILHPLTKSNSTYIIMPMLSE